MMHLLDNTPKSKYRSKYRAKNWFEINNDSRGAYNTNSQIRFKMSTLK